MAEELRQLHPEDIRVSLKPSKDTYADPGELGDYRVWYIPQVPGKPFLVTVSTLDSAINILVLLEQFSSWEFHEKIKPDFSDASGIMRYTADGWDEVDSEEYVPRRMAIMAAILR